MLYTINRWAVFPPSSLTTKGQIPYILGPPDLVDSCLFPLTAFVLSHSSFLPRKIFHLQLLAGYLNFPELYQHTSFLQVFKLSKHSEKANERCVGYM